MKKESVVILFGKIDGKIEAVCCFPRNKPHKYENQNGCLQAYQS